MIASTTASRTLAGYGAEVLHVARDQGFEHDGLVVDVNVGMRSTMLDLKNPEQNRVQQRLVPRADVFVGGLPRPQDGGARLRRGGASHA